MVNRKIGELEAVGQMVQSQTPTALGGINADFFVSTGIRYASDVEMARGPMVKSGTVVRGTYRPQRVVGVDSLIHPYGGDLSLRGAVRPRVPDAAKVPLR